MATIHKNTSRKRLELKTFKGFHAPYYTQVPDELFDILLPYLGEAELKVLLYVCRRTFGFKKGSDRISKSQLENGITKKNGTKLDGGTGLSRRSVRLGVESLVKKNILIKKRHASNRKGDETTEYALNIINYTPPGVPSTQGGGVKGTPGLGTEVPTQDTVRQVKKNVTNKPLKQSKKDRTKSDFENPFTANEYISGLNLQKTNNKNKNLDEINHLTDQILAVCGDSRSTAFYRQIAELCPSNLIHRNLASVKDMKETNQIKKSPGALFTALIKKDSENNSIDLKLKS